MLRASRISLAAGTFYGMAGMPFNLKIFVAGAFLKAWPGLSSADHHRLLRHPETNRLNFNLADFHRTARVVRFSNTMKEPDPLKLAPRAAMLLWQAHWRYHRCLCNSISMGRLSFSCEIFDQLFWAKRNFIKYFAGLSKEARGSMAPAICPRRQCSTGKCAPSWVDK